MLRYGVEMGDEAIRHLLGGRPGDSKAEGWDPGREAARPWGHIKSWGFGGMSGYSCPCWVMLGE